MGQHSVDLYKAESPENMLQNVAAWLSLGQMFYACHISVRHVSGPERCFIYY